MSNITVGELRAMLDGLSDDTEVYILQQPSWPFVYSVRAVVGIDELLRIQLNEKRDEIIEAMKSSWRDIFEETDPEYIKEAKAIDEMIDEELIEAMIDEDYNELKGKEIVYIVEGQQLRYANGVEKNGFEY